MALVGSRRSGKLLQKLVVVQKQGVCGFWRWLNHVFNAWTVIEEQKIVIKVLKAQPPVILYRKKRGAIPKCGDTKEKLRGITPARPRKLSTLSKRHKTVTRTYGGCLSASAVKERIIRAFLTEEQKIVIKVLKAQHQAAKKAGKA